MPEDLAKLEDEVSNDPGKGRFYELAREYQRLGRLDDAASICEEGLAINATRWQARILLAQVYVARGEFKEAGAQVQKVLLALPDNVPANHLAADIFYALGDSEKALKHYKIVQLFEPGIQQVDERVAELEGAPLSAGTAETPIPSTPSNNESQEPEEFPKQTVAVETAPHIQQEQPKEVEDGETAVTPPMEIESPLESLDTASSWEIAEEENEGESETGESDIFGEEEEENLEAVLTGETDENWEDTRNSVTYGDEEQQAEPIEEELEVGFEEAQEEEAGKVGQSSDVSFGTNTLAEMYEEQGYPEKAIEVYQRLLLKDPDNRRVLDEIERLKRKVLGEADVSPVVEDTDVKRAIRQKRIHLLETWLHNLRGRADV